MESERWQRSRRFPAYEVSDHGRIRRLEPAKGATVGKILRPGRDGAGYLIINAAEGCGTYRTARVHVLVADCFLGARPLGLVVNHKNGDKADARAVNLEYITKSQDIYHAVAVLGVPRPSKLTPERRRLLVQLIYLREWPYYELAEVFGVSTSRVGRIAVEHRIQ